MGTKQSKPKNKKNQENKSKDTNDIIEPKKQDDVVRVKKFKTSKELNKFNLKLTQQGNDIADYIFIKVIVFLY